MHRVEMHRSSFAVASFASLAWIACGCKHASQPSPTDEDARPYSRIEERTIDFHDSMFPPPSCEVVLDGKTIGKGANHPWHVSIGEMREDDFLAAIPRMRVVVDSTCGPAELPVVKCSAGYCFGDRALILRLDDEGGAATTVTLGTKKVELAAGELKTIETTVGACDAARLVQIGGDEVGKLERDPSWKGDDRESYLVDVTGKHCYEAGQVAYGQALAFAPKPLPKARIRALDATFWFTRPDEKTLALEGEKSVMLRQVAHCGKSL
jgi:hypothetical protein